MDRWGPVLSGTWYGTCRPATWSPGVLDVPRNPEILVPWISAVTVMPRYLSPWVTDYLAPYVPASLGTWIPGLPGSLGYLASLRHRDLWLPESLGYLTPLGT